MAPTWPSRWSGSSTSWCKAADPPPQRIGLSATQRPLEEIGRFLGGSTDGGSPRPVTIVDAGRRKPMDVEVVIPVADMSRLGEIVDEPASGPATNGPARSSIWPSVHPRLLELIRAHRSTLIFVNARRLAERLAARLNELAEAEADGQPVTAPTSDFVGATGHGGDLVKAHHGSLSREQRLHIEDQLKSGALKALVATSSLELGIDMGAIDLVVQVESPGSVASGLQRIGRAGHNVGDTSRGKIFPKHRGDLVEAAVVVDRMGKGLIEETHYPRNALDVLAQQVVAMVAMDEWVVDDLAAPRPPRCPLRRAQRRRPHLRARPPRPGATRATSSPSCVPGWCGTGWEGPSGDGRGPSASP